VQPKQFKIRPDGFNEVKKTYLFKLVPVILLATAAGITIAHYYYRDKGDDFNSLPFVIPIVGLMSIFSIYRSVNKQKELFESYVLSINETSIIREQKDTPTVTLSKWEIAQIQKLSNGYYQIKGSNSSDIICIPPQLEGYTEMEALLLGLSTTNTKQVPWHERYAIIIIILGLGLMVTFFLLKDRILLTLTGLPLIGMLAWSLYEGHRSKNLDKKTKRGLLWLYVVIFAMAARLIASWIDSSLLS
jgi:hypothetical protein